MLVKCTMLINLATNTGNTVPAAHRVGGWSESVYYVGNSITDCREKFYLGNQVFGQSLCNFRARLLPVGAAVIGQRFQLMTPLGPSQSVNRVFLGSSTLKGDVPQMALLCKVPGINVANARQLIIRGLPDVRVYEGEYKPSDEFGISLGLFFGALNAFAFRGRDLTQAKKPMFYIDANGVPNWHQFGPDAAVGDLMEVTATKNASGATIKRRVKVTVLANNATVHTVQPWTDGMCIGGSMRKISYVYPLMDGVNTSIGRVITRKVGRPIGGYVGRRSKKS